MNTLRSTIASAINPLTPRPAKPYQFTSRDVLKVMSRFSESAASHDELAEIVAGLIVMLERPNALGSQCTNVITDMCSEILGQIEQDKLDQQAKAMWEATNQRRAA